MDANEYKKQNYDRFFVNVPKGEKEVYAECAKKLNMTVSKMIRLALDRYIDKNRIEGEEG